MKNTVGIGGLLAVIAFSGCMKDELPVPMQPRGGAVFEE